MLDTVKPDHWPNVRIDPVDNATIITTLGPGDVLEAPLGPDGRIYYDGGYVFVNTPGYQPAVGWTWLEFWTLEAQANTEPVEELRAAKNRLEAALADSALLVKGMTASLDAVRYAIGTWEE